MAHIVAYAPSLSTPPEPLDRDNDDAGGESLEFRVEMAARLAYDLDRVPGWQGMSSNPVPRTKVCYGKRTLKEHLEEEHEYTDHRMLAEKLESCRIGRNCTIDYASKEGPSGLGREIRPH